MCIVTESGDADARLSITPVLRDERERVPLTDSTRREAVLMICARDAETERNGKL
jgi:antitoxin (DNA-binding transcriptional repressor) of toxin-antitoxin stability system